MELISKSKVLDFINTIRNEMYDTPNDFKDVGAKQALDALEVCINTLETKEVDLTDERMKDCPYRVVGCEKYSGTVTECNGACAWVVDYPKLKELKAKKGE